MKAERMKKRGAAKTALQSTDVAGNLAKPKWIRARSPDSPEVRRLIRILRDHNLHTVCEEARCPNLGECFRCGTATFIVMGDVCTRRCPFCDVAHGRPGPLDPDEPRNLAEVVKAMGLNYVVITSVNRDDLNDAGAGHLVRCIEEIRKLDGSIKVEILVPDFRGKVHFALAILGQALPDVFNHNLETVPRLYRKVRPGAGYRESLELLWLFKLLHEDIPTKSGLMVGLGETDEEVFEVMRHLREHNCDMLTIGQYLRPSRDHLPVERYVEPEQFEKFKERGLAMGFSQVASGPLVRSSYHAELLAKPVL